MASQWPWWSALLMLAAVVLPGATNVQPAPPTPLFAVEVVAADLPEPTPTPSGAPAPASEVAVEQQSVEASSMLAAVQVVALYGFPGIAVMGDLGKYTPDEAAAAAARLASQYDALNGDRGAVGALELIVGVAQRTPRADGSYLNRLDAEVIAAYVEVARAHEVLLILDTQLGMADPVGEAQRLEPFLLEPFVHLALDPEFAMRAEGVPPGEAIGSLDSSEVNAVQAYLAGLVRQHALPPKMLVVHQFRADMLTHSSPWIDVPEVARVIDVDGWGDLETKLETYAAYGLAPYAQYAGIKLFEGWDTPLLTPEQVLALPRVPDLVVYQ